MREMKSELPDINRFERIVFKRKNTLKLLLSFSLRLMNARQVGLLMGTDKIILNFYLLTNGIEELFINLTAGAYPGCS